MKNHSYSYLIFFETKLLDSETRVVIAFCLSSTKDSNTVLTLFKESRNITDRFDSYNMPVIMAYPKSKHYVYHSFSDDLSNNVIESFNKTFKA